LKNITLIAHKKQPEAVLRGGQFDSWGCWWPCSYKAKQTYWTLSVVSSFIWPIKSFLHTPTDTENSWFNIATLCYNLCHTSK